MTMHQSVNVRSRQYQVEFDQGRHHRAKIGYVLLATEQTIQDDVMRLRPDGVGVHITRAEIPDSITNETLAAQADLLAERAATLLPDGSLDVVCYACTSGSLVIGEDRVFAELNKAQPQAKATSLITGVMRSLEAVGAKRIVVGTPYLDEINQAEACYMAERGFEIVDIQGLNLEKDSDMVRVTPDFHPRVCRFAGPAGCRCGVHLVRCASDAGRDRRDRGCHRQAGDLLQPGDDLGHAETGRYRRPV
jgi:maleate isomerase